jgi:pimeloyl-ACP methyl ester carboxylesterase
MSALPVIFLPGGIQPAAIQFGPLLNCFQKHEIQPLLKDLEVYEKETPPDHYNLNLEIEGLKAVADSANLKRLHVVAYSGGAAIALAFAAAYPHRLKSLALFEPATIPCKIWRNQEAEKQAEFDRIMTLPPAEQMREFMRAHLRPGVPIPPPPQGDPPPWMVRRPAGLRALDKAFAMYDLDLSRLKFVNGPVYLAYGSLSDAIEERKAAMLASYLPNVQIEAYEGRHHFDTPQHAEATRFAQALRVLWEKAEE